MALAFIPITLRNNVKPDTLPDPSKEKNRVKQKKKEKQLGLTFYSI